MKPKYTLLRTYIETTVFSLGAVAFFYYMSPTDPLWVHASYPWIWLVPALIALRHGRLPGLFSATIVIAMMLNTMYSMLFSWDVYQLWMLGGFTFSLICGEFHAMWQRKQFALEKRTNYLDERIESLSRAYGIMRVSHDRLEESLIVKPATLREAFAEMRALLKKLHGKLDGDAANQYMEIIVYYAALDKAALYLKKDGSFDITPAASIGIHDNLNLSDPLVKKCLEREQTTFLSINLLDENETSQYLAVIPMITSDNDILGLLTITDMAFITLNEETLKLIMLLLAYAADEVAAENYASKLKQKYPACPSHFASELYKLKHLCEISQVDSTLFAYYLPEHKVKKDVIAMLIQQKRGLDVIWEIKRDDLTIFIILMPLTERSMLTGYITRMTEVFQDRFGVKFGQPPVEIRYRQLSTQRSIDSIIEDLLAYDLTI